MTATARKPLRHGYEEDFAAWSAEQAALIRAGRWAETDIEHLAEEIESLGKSDRRALAGHLEIVLMHLLKWQFQPARRSSSWEVSIRNGRTEAQEILADSPSLRRLVPELVARRYRNARLNAAAETGLPAGSFPEDCPYSVEQILDFDFLPEDDGRPA